MLGFLNEKSHGGWPHPKYLFLHTDIRYYWSKQIWCLLKNRNLTKKNSLTNEMFDFLSSIPNSNQFFHFMLSLHGLPHWICKSRTLRRNWPNIQEHQEPTIQALHLLVEEAQLIQPSKTNGEESGCRTVPVTSDKTRPSSQLHYWSKSLWWRAALAQ